MTHEPLYVLSSMRIGNPILTVISLHVSFSFSSCSNAFSLSQLLRKTSSHPYPVMHNSGKQRMRAPSRLACSIALRIFSALPLQSKGVWFKVAPASFNRFTIVPPVFLIVRRFCRLRLAQLSSCCCHSPCLPRYCQ